jgi:hypothetical protein
MVTELDKDVAKVLLMEMLPELEDLLSDFEDVQLAVNPLLRRIQPVITALYGPRPSYLVVCLGNEVGSSGITAAFTDLIQHIKLLTEGPNGLTVG